jgi:hypothetical protein
VTKKTKQTGPNENLPPVWKLGGSSDGGIEVFMRGNSTDRLMNALNF